jgi:hypothetical protein
MSSPAREREKRAIREAEDIAREQERIRLDSRSVWERIEDLKVEDGLKELLHRLAEAAGLEQ